MSIVKKIPMLVFSYVHDHGMDKDSLSVEDFVLAQDIETRMTSVFHINNKKVNGKDTSFKFYDVKQMELLRDRIDYLCVCKPLIGRDKAKSWVYSMSRDIEKEKKEISINKVFDKLKEDSSKLVDPLKKECIAVARKLIPQLPKNFDIKVTLDWDRSRKHSYGFYEEINLSEDGLVQCEVILAMKSFFSPTGKPLNLTREEYSSFKNDPDIGQFSTKIWQFHMLTMFCHQAAHGIQEFCQHELEMGSKYSIHHGEGFESLYRAFRKEIVNPRLSKQKIKVGRK
ncbi:hypothetical protein [Vibrio metschnikovii]|uniref:Uncharacterized protein n=1 Tax=Vibrio metschnikovii TaxID=28172 RepID=A0A9X0RAK6_VIBME|nr:hypothetical protein [Vibrio metschnikovii]MBC5851471.1 hypothetical protein [Vibrio metschnikovii]